MLPPEFQKLISSFSPLFSKNIFIRVRILLLGLILTKGNRTICSILRTLDLSQVKDWSKYHRVLSRAKWSSFHCSKILLSKLLSNFVKGNQVVMVIDETIERRWGSQIKARGIYRDAVRSSKKHLVKCSGLRWICVMLLVPIGWAGRTWALPFLTVLAPSKPYHTLQGKTHKTISDWARQISKTLHRWVPDFEKIIVGDGSYASMNLLADSRDYVTWIVRFRFDAGLYDFPPIFKQGQKRPVGRPPIKGERQPSLQQVMEDKNTKWQKVKFSRWYSYKDKTLEITSGTAIWYRGGKPIVPHRWVIIRDPEGKTKPAAILCTDPNKSPFEIVQHYAKRWQAEVTLQEVRVHLGVETQRQWSDLAILRTTPILMATFSIITLWANKMKNIEINQTTW